MAELMTDSAYAVNQDSLWLAGITVKFDSTGIVTHIDTIFLVPEKVKSMRPNKPLVIAGKVGTLAGKDDEYQINRTVTIAVKLLIVHIGIGSIDRCPNQRRAVLSSFSIILAVVKGIWTYHRKFRLKLAVAVVREVIAHTAGTRHVVKTSVPLLVGHVVHQLLIVFA